MDQAIWAKIHGATTHFPLALALCSAALDSGGFLLATRPLGRNLHVAGYWTMLIGALGSIPAVASGLLMTKGSVWGHGYLRLHHVYVWPAFALLVALATWRVSAGENITRRMFAGYLLATGAAAGLMLAAGYWGGEMMIHP